MRKILLGLLVGLLLAAPTAWSVLRRDTLQATPHGYKLPSLVVTGTSEFDGAVTLPTGDITSTEILNATITADDLGTDSVAADEIAAGAVGTSELATGAVASADVGGFATDSIIACGQLVSSSTVYLGPSTAAYLGSGADTSAGGTVCDALDSGTESTADAPIATTFGAIKIHGMYCRVTSDPASDVVFTLRSAAADLTPSVTCTVAGTGSSQHCVSTTPTTVDVAANATIAVKVVTLEDLSLQDGWCKIFFSLS